MKRSVVAVMLSVVMTLSMSSIAGAETMEERITALEKRVAELEAIVGVYSIEADTEIDTEIETETEEAVLMDEQDFLDDIVASFNARYVVAKRYTNAEINAMTNDELIEYDSECAEAERDFYEKYANAKFEDLNIQYLCNQYISGLKKQLQCKSDYEQTGDYEKTINQFNSGYYNRAYVIVELSDYYELPFGDVSGMRENTADMDSLNEAETRNAAVDHATVQKTQELLNEIGFFCGTADGISGKRTVKSIKRFQEMYGYDPIDGMIDEELISQIENELSKK